MKRSSYHLTQAECDRLKLLCTVHSQATAASIVGCSKGAVTAAKRRGWRAGPTLNRRPRPSDFALLASEMAKEDLCAHYRCDWETISRWLIGVERAYRKKIPPQSQLNIPADFRDVIGRLGPRAAAAHYRRAPSTIWRWRMKLGMLPAKHSNDNGPGWVERYVQRRSA